MNRTHEYDGENNLPPPPPWWLAPLIALLFFAFMTIAALICTSCVCSITCRPDVPATVEIIKNISTK